jgi:uncharacterized protein (DUF1778 family)
MGISENKAASNARYAAKLDQLRIQPTKEKGAEIRAAAAAAGQSVQAYVLQAVHDRMEKEKARE